MDFLIYYYWYHTCFPLDVEVALGIHRNLFLWHKLFSWIHQQGKSLGRKDRQSLKNWFSLKRELNPSHCFYWFPNRKLSWFSNGKFHDNWSRVFYYVTMQHIVLELIPIPTNFVGNWCLWIWFPTHCSSFWTQEGRWGPFHIFPRASSIICTLVQFYQTFLRQWKNLFATVWMLALKRYINIFLAYLPMN